MHIEIHNERMVKTYICQQPGPKELPSPPAELPLKSTQEASEEERL